MSSRVDMRRKRAVEFVIDRVGGSVRPSAPPSAPLLPAEGLSAPALVSSGVRAAKRQKRADVSLYDLWSAPADVKVSGAAAATVLPSGAVVRVVDAISYNPTAQTLGAANASNVEKERRRQEQTQRRHRALHPDEAAVSTAPASSDDESGDVRGPLRPIVTDTARLSRAARARRIRAAELLSRRLAAREERRRLTQLNRIPTILSQLRRAQHLRQQKREFRLERRRAHVKRINGADVDTLTPPIFSSSRARHIAMSDMNIDVDIPLPNERPTALREVGSSHTAVADAFARFQRRRLIAYELPQAKHKNKRKLKSFIRDNQERTGGRWKESSDEDER